ncbi:hypothetical protein [Acinetobacter towneri]|uniref:hypothetical protein n=1 Tax=Acinetobacter towneri TaxID=202956 RepID=UPI0002CDF8BD|nr:hypothetical protein [Acinetobacter towneri]ENV70717.1 hypothetical protein F947_00723 [Acinetobacter towneri DSM 14962 = CIP 107472]
MKFKQKWLGGISGLFIACSVLVGCGGVQSQSPSADTILKYARETDPNIVQLQVQKCKVFNLFEGQPGTGPQYDVHRCTILVERMNHEINQTYTREELWDLDQDQYDGSWSIYNYK